MPADSPLIVIAVSDPALAASPRFAALKNELYAEGIRGQGGTPALINTATPADERERLLAAMSGLVLSGGADLEPGLYGQKANGATGMDHERDELELAAWREAERRAVPVLGICRGLQAINVFMGGSLLQDVPSHAGIPYGQGQAHVHPIEIDRDTILGRTLGGAAVSGPLKLTVNTFHHQAVGEEMLAPGLRPAAWAESEFGRLVEGFEGTGDRWLVAVQCHPERIDSTPDEFDHLWEAFVGAVQVSPASAPGSAVGSITRPG